MTLNVNIKLLNPRAVAPAYAKTDDACFDLRALFDGEPVTIEPGKAHIFGTGLSFEVPSGHVFTVFSRSGHGFTYDVSLSNGTGIIDAGYRGELMVKLRNDGSAPFTVKDGDRIAQGMVLPIPRVSFTVVSELSESARGTGGLGSTGVA